MAKFRARWQRWGACGAVALTLAACSGDSDDAPVGEACEASGSDDLCEEAARDESDGTNIEGPSSAPALDGDEATAFKVDVDDFK
jgi:hypothetical protein